MSFTFKEHYDANDLIGIVKKLRAPDGCPWDKVQTHQTIRSEFIEEVYEAVEAIDENDTEHLREELGDVLLQVVFHCVLETEQNHFTLNDVADDVCQKMILRHPHVFGTVDAETTEEVLKNWDAIKMQSKSQTTASETMESVSRTLPSLMRGEKLWKKADRGGFRYENVMDVIALTERQLAALKASVLAEQTQDYERQMGELLLSVTGLSRFLHTDCEKSLYFACDDFIARFKALEAAAGAQGIEIQKSDPGMIHQLWDDISKKDKNGGNENEQD